MILLPNNVDISQKFIQLDELLKLFLYVLLIKNRNTINSYLFELFNMQIYDKGWYGLQKFEGI